ncbi:MAG: redoxin domain-containing protein [Saprospirales bacterium]|nr:redoxin domain-containing protein [Saprospirales bacterium]
MKQLLVLLLLISYLLPRTQANTLLLPLPNGSTAPNWTLTDENGVTHTLYDYLDQGYTVYIDFFATWCGICWNYKQAGHLNNLYNQYGPNGTDKVRVFSIEGDISTPASALYGGSGSVGNWVAGVPHPVIHAPDGTVPGAYAIVSFPTVYAICPDRKVYNVGTAPLATLVNWISSCSLDAAAEVTNASCTGQSNGSIDLSTTGGVGTISYNWSNGPTTQDINNLATGNYSCTLTDGQGRSISAGPFTVEAPQAIVAFGQATQPSCHGNDGALAVSAAGGTAPYTYNAGNGPSSNPIITGLSAGAYSVSVTDVNGCEKVIEVVVPQETPPIANAGPDLVITCDEPTVVLNGSGSSTGPTITYSWSTIDGLIINPGFLNPSAGEPGTYVLEVVDANTGCTSFDSTLVVADDAVPTINISSTDTLTCANPQIVVSTLDLGPCFEYAWTTTDGIIIEINGNEVVIAAPGTYNLIVTNTCTGCAGTGSFMVFAAAALESEVAEVQDVACFGGQSGAIEVAASGGTPLIPMSGRPAKRDP